MVDISGARLGSLLLGYAHTFTGAVKLHRFDSFSRLHDEQVRNTNAFHLKVGPH